MVEATTPSLLSTVTVLLFCLLFSSSYSRSVDNGVNASNVLNNMLNPNVYDKRLRPNFEGAPVNVYLTLFLTSIGGLNEKEMQFESTFFLRQVWRDTRLAYGTSYTKRNLTLGGEIMEQLWKPDTYINNEKSSLAPKHQFLLTIDPTGQIVYSQRMTVIASCMMDLRNFPMDTQTCSIMFESYGMNNKDLILNWFTKPSESYKAAVALSDNIVMSQFALDKYTAEVQNAKYATGTFTILKLSFVIRRKKFYYVVQTYIPTILITILSWVSFWIPRSSPPARVALGITTVLALTTLVFGIQTSMPKVSYVKAIDWFLMVSFLFVFTALIEYPSSTFIKFQAKKLTKKGTIILKRVKGEKNHDDENGGDYPMSAAKYGSTSTNKEDSLEEQSNIQEERHSRLRNHRDPVDGNDVIINHRRYDTDGLRELSAGDPDVTSFNENFIDNEEINIVDKYAKICFPAAYFLYNVGYWTVYLLAASQGN